MTAAPVFLPGNFSGHRSLVGCSPQSHRVDLVEHTHTSFRVTKMSHNVCVCFPLGKKKKTWIFKVVPWRNLPAKLLQSCPTLCDPIDGRPPGSAVPEILQARTLEWVAISFSNAWKWKVKVKSLSHAQPSATSSTAAYQAPSSMGFSRQEYWSGMPLPSPEICLAFLKLRGEKFTISLTKACFVVSFYRE